MSRPFQSLYKRPGENQGKYGILAAASGSSILCFDIVSGDLASVWTSQQDPENSLKKAAVAEKQRLNNPALNETANNGSKRPSKRQKVSSLGEGSGTSTGHPFENDRDLEAEPAPALQHSSAIIKLTGTRDGRYLIAVTDDKCIRVLEFEQDGFLKQLSERLMSKRPCAISLTPDENTILCADKFGDVYSLPLLEISNGVSFKTGRDSCTISSKEDQPFIKPFIPAANTKTVHTLRNRRALHDQQTRTKIVPKFKSSNLEHHLLLGHVSMLTDLLCISTSDYTSDPTQPKTYIFTSDRDEHIRVSRGIPQAHIIEGFCLGHTEFVSKLCIPHWHQQILISGGGDDYLLTWNWLSGEILQKIDLKSHVDDFRRHYISASDRLRTNSVQDLSEDRHSHFAGIAVSGIWAVNCLGTNIGNSGGEVVVTCEGVPALFMFHLGFDLRLGFREYITCLGNVLDVAVLDNRCSIIYSLDNFHIPFSITQIADADEQTARSPLGSLTLDSSGRWKQCDIMQNVIAGLKNNEAKKDADDINQGNDRGSLSALLYGIENLRKRGQDEPE